MLMESYRSVYYMINKNPVDNMKYAEDAARVSVFVHFIATRTKLFGKQYEGPLFTVMEERLPKFFASLILRHFVMLQHVQTVIKLILVKSFKKLIFFKFTKNFIFNFFNRTPSACQITSPWDRPLYVLCSIS